jgi:probable rRNA maturation factor
MSKDEHTIDVEFDIAAEDVRADWTAMEELVRHICTQADVKDALVAIRIVDDERMIEAHRQYMQLDSTTDVLSFDLSDEFEPKPNFALIVNAAMAARQAAERGHSSQAELGLYITHGLLHNLGYDDLDEEQALEMHQKEDELLERHGFGRVYFDKT